ncbi:MAG: hypothetical protein AB7G11_00795 [Phycisphaerales bacterium]
MKVCSVLALAVVAGAAASANAFEFRCRFVERVGTMDVVLAGNTIDASNGAARIIRVQFGVFDDATSAAPAGGYVGWNVGTLAVSGPSGNSAEDIASGVPAGSGGPLARLAPFNFAPGGNGVGADGAGVFDMLTGIDNTLGTQSPIWQCDSAGNAPPQPGAVIRGLNTFVSTYAFRINPADMGGMNYTVTASGNLIAATEWRTVGTPNPPDCGDPGDPMDDQPGSVTYAPFPTAPEAFQCVLTVVVPGPGSAALLGLGGLIAARRRRA